MSEVFMFIGQNFIVASISLIVGVTVAWIAAHMRNKPSKDNHACQARHENLNESITEIKTGVVQLQTKFEYTEKTLDKIDTTLGNIVERMAVVEVKAT